MRKQLLGEEQANGHHASEQSSPTDSHDDESDEAGQSGSKEEDSQDTTKLRSESPEGGLKEDDSDSTVTAASEAQNHHVGNGKKRSPTAWDDASKSPSGTAGESARDNEDGHMNDAKEDIQNDFNRVHGAEAHKDASGEGSEDEEDEEQNLQIDLLKQLMNRTVQLEAEARQMLLDSMEKGVARTLLLADRNDELF